MAGGTRIHLSTSTFGSALALVFWRITREARGLQPMVLRVRSQRSGAIFLAATGNSVVKNEEGSARPVRMG